MLSGDGGYDPGKIKSESTKEIGEDQIQAIFAALDQTGFWKLPVDDKVIGLDGSQLIVETIKDGKYQVRVRWTPEHESEARGLSKIIEFYSAEFRGAGFWKPNEE